MHIFFTWTIAFSNSYGARVVSTIIVISSLKILWSSLSSDCKPDGGMDGCYIKWALRSTLANHPPICAACRSFGAPHSVGVMSSWIVFWCFTGCLYVLIGSIVSIALPLQYHGGQLECGIWSTYYGVSITHPLCIPSSKIMSAVPSSLMTKIMRNESRILPQRFWSPVFVSAIKDSGTQPSGSTT
jgi:hypothetical protein